MALSDGQNFVTLRQVVDDFIITMDSDDFISNVNDAAIRNIALRGIREFGFDVSSRVRSLKRTVDTSNNTVQLPDDYVDLVKLGVVGEDGVLHVLGQNKNINYSQRIQQIDTDDPPDGIVDSDTSSTSNSGTGPLDIEVNRILNREDSKGSTSGTDSTDNDFDYYVFQNYLYQGGLGRLYGVGGGHLRGEYRINLDQNRIEIDTESGVAEVVIEYIADEARSTNPVIHVYIEEALR